MAGRSVTKSFTFDVHRDADILAFLEGQDPRGQSRLVRRALRDLLQQQEGPGISWQEIVDACREAIRRELTGRLVLQEGSVIVSETPEPETEAARNLAGLEEELEGWE